MRPLPFLLLAAILVSGSSVLRAADPSEPSTSLPQAAAPAGTAPETAAPPTEAPATAAQPAPAGKTQSAANDAIATSDQSPATASDAAASAAAPEPTPQAESTATPAATTAPAAAPPQVITAQIDPELSLRLSLLEKTILAQSQGQQAIYSETTRMLMFFGSACVAMGLIAMIAAVFLMNRTLASVSTITAHVTHAQSVPALPGGSVAALAPAAGGQPTGFEKVQASGQRFQSRMTALEQRLQELEHLAGHDAAAAVPAAADGAVPAPVEPIEPEPPPARRTVPRSAILVHKAETLMNLGKLADAIAVLDEAATLDGDPAEIHLARGRVLEKMGRLGDALQSYDLAVTTDQTNTAALLMKAGVLNRQERFEEALSCYERALAVHKASN